MKTVLILILCVSCARHSQMLKISTHPDGANVLREDKEGKLQSLGLTPLETSLEPGISDLTVSKEGYSDERVLVANESGDATEISLKLKSKSKDSQTESGQRLERLARDLVRAHNLLTKKSLSEARSVLTALAGEFPYVSVTYDLLGNASYLERDVTSALKYYEKSLSLNPENIETRRMVERLKGNP